jgi:hypothetical protein
VATCRSEVTSARESKNGYVNVLLRNCTSLDARTISAGTIQHMTNHARGPDCASRCIEVDRGFCCAATS